MAFSFGGKLELITEENILYAIMIATFFMGVFTCRVVTRLLEVSHAARIVQSTIYHCLLMCSKIQEDVAFLQELKYKTLGESTIEPARIHEFKQIDEQIMTHWKESVIRNIVINSPPSFAFVVKFATWKEAMQELNRIREAE